MTDAGAPSRSLLQRMLARSWTNTATTFAVIGRRFRQRPALYDRIFWLPWTIGCVLLAALAAIGEVVIRYTDGMEQRVIIIGQAA